MVQHNASQTTIHTMANTYHRTYCTQMTAAEINHQQRSTNQAQHTKVGLVTIFLSSTQTQTEQRKDDNQNIDIQLA